MKVEIQVDPRMNVLNNVGGGARLRLVCFFGILLRAIVLLTKKSEKKTRFTLTSQKVISWGRCRDGVFFTRYFVRSIKLPFIER